MLRVRRPGLTYPVREDWHYVGSTGEPAFAGTWDNVGTQDLAFRARETGIFDLMGTVGSDWSGSTVFTLPAGYRPATTSYFAAIGDTISGAYVVSAVKGIVNTDGTITLAKTSAATVDRVFISAQIFLSPPTTAP